MKIEYFLLWLSMKAIKKILFPISFKLKLKRGINNMFVLLLSFHNTVILPILFPNFPFHDKDIISPKS